MTEVSTWDRQISDELREAADKIARQRRQLVAERLRTKFRVIDTNGEKQDDRRSE